MYIELVEHFRHRLFANFLSKKEKHFRIVSYAGIFVYFKTRQ